MTMARIGYDVEGCRPGRCLVAGCDLRVLCKGLGFDFFLSAIIMRNLFNVKIWCGDIDLKSCPETSRIWVCGFVRPGTVCVDSKPVVSKHDSQQYSFQSDAHTK